MDDNFLEPPKRLLKEYVQHGLLFLLDTLFMLFWLGMQALYHVASEWIIHKAGIGLIDKTVKLCFDIAFGAITFFWVVRTVWRAHKHAYTPPRTRRRTHTR